MNFFEAEAVTAGYGNRTVIQDISLFCEKGEIVCILGANGSGKTTLLKALCGILPYRGRCTLEGRELRGLRPREMAKLCSYIPQRSGIGIDISLLDVVMMGFNPRLGLLANPSADMVAAARAALDRVGLGQRQGENYQTLSEGQKQLCILARTLVSGSRLLLLDEPESALDIRYRAQMLRILRSWAGEGRCVLVTLHDPTLALNGCDRLVLLEKGRVSAVLHPKTDDLPQMEEALSRIYGSVTLTRCRDNRGKTHLVMLKEEEE